MNQPKETPKQEQKKKPEENNSVPTPPTPVPDPVPPVPDPVIPKPKQVTISVKGNEGYLLGAKRWMYKKVIQFIKYCSVQD